MNLRRLDFDSEKHILKTEFIQLMTGLSLALAFHQVGELESQQDLDCIEDLMVLDLQMQAWTTVKI